MNVPFFNAQRTINDHRTRTTLLNFAALHHHPMNSTFLIFFHSLLRYGVLIAVAYAGIVHLLGFLRRSPILNGDRVMAIVAMVLSHVQLVIGLLLYFMGGWYAVDASTKAGRFMKMEHIGTMIIAIALVTLGRSLSKRAKVERIKQRHVAVFYLIALLLMLWAIPWPFSEIGKLLNAAWI